MIISATTTGGMHRHPMTPTPNQDSIFTYEDDDIQVAVVCDGCGSIPMSHVGSAVTAKLFGRALKANFGYYDEPFKRSFEDIFSDIGDLWFAGIPKDWFLTTIVAAVVKDGICYSICWGDGYRRVKLKNGLFNSYMDDRQAAPNYPLRDTPESFEPDISEEGVGKVMIGSDGLTDVIGLDRFDFWNYRSSAALQRKLNTYNFRKPYLLPDDTSLVIIK